MKYLYTVAVLLAVLVGGSLWYNHYINRSAGILVQKIEDVSDEIQNQEWKRAETQLKEIEKQWGGTKDVWSVLLNHQEIDQIDLGLTRLTEYVRMQSPVLAVSELSALRLLMGHIADSETLTLKNIF